MDSDQEDLDLSLGGLNVTSDLTGDLAGILASNMIQAALSGALQPRPPQGPRREGPPRAGASRSYRKQSSSELDTDLDLEGEDFEMLDQSELNQMDPLGGAGGRGAGRAIRTDRLVVIDWTASSKGELAFERISQIFPYQNANSPKLKGVVT
ncbi:hypothetical protein NFI96_000189, partial [Prochilodus magdalenae]